MPEGGSARWAPSGRRVSIVGGLWAVVNKVIAWPSARHCPHAHPSGSTRRTIPLQHSVPQTHHARLQVDSDKIVEWLEEKIPSPPMKADSPDA
jgi:hypothetical protein